MLNFGSSDIKITDEEFKLLSELIDSYCGLYYPESKKYIIESRLSVRVKELNFSNFKEYYYFLKFDSTKAKEFDKVIDILTTNETYFFREFNQIKTLIHEIIPDIINSNSSFLKKIKVWCAASSSGEEPFTIKIESIENNVLKPGWQMDILGTDISLKILKKAAEGLYSNFSFRGVDKKYIEKYFMPVENNKFKLKETILKGVRFERFNLLDFNNYNKYKEIDVIFCRNVLIYFTDDIKKKVVNNLYNSLKKGGVLFLGHSESLFKFSTAFELKQFKNGIGYIKV